MIIIFLVISKEKAFYWYGEAYKYIENDVNLKGNVLYRVGKCYLHGFGTEKNIPFAYKLLSKSEVELFQKIIDGDQFAGVIDRQWPQCNRIQKRENR